MAYRKRSRVPKKRSKKIFTGSAARTHKMNLSVPGNIKRGGWRL